MKKETLVAGGRLRVFLTAILSLLTALVGQTQTISPNKTAAQLAAALAGPGVTVSNPTLTCPSNANGTFTGGTNNLSIASGILLTSGDAAAVDNPASFFESTDNSSGGDADLTALSGNATQDACVLEFDFTASGDSVNFQYQFGSEEYPNFTCTEFNDVFGFFISGPGYGGPTNIALVPGTTIPVAINSVNGGSPTGAGVIATCNAMGPGSPFPAYFINNVGFGAPAYDGLTVVLNAKAAVTPCASYHMKLGVADASDGILSSGVFLEQGSLTVLPPTIVGCPGNITTFTGPGATVCGTNVTYTAPTTVNNCVGVTVTSNHNSGDFFPVGTTTVTYTFTNAGGSSICTFTVKVIDNTPPVAVCKNATVTLSGGTATLTPAMVNDGSHDNCGTVTLVSVTPNSFTCADAGKTYPVTLTVMDGVGLTSTCTATVTVNGVVPTCTISVTPSDTTCTGGVATNIYLGYGPQSATLKVNPSGGSSFTYLWSGPTSYLSCTTCQSPVFTPTVGGTYTFTATVTNNFGCMTTCSVTFCVKDVRAPSNGNAQKIYVCHIPPGNPLNPQSLSISINAVPAHVCLHGGDQLGYCGQTCGGPVARFITGNGPVIPDQVTVAPNPNNGVFVVTLPQIGDNTQLLVTDLQGKVIQRRMLTEKDGHTINVQLGNVPVGIYLLDVYNDGEHQRVKLEVR
jgi:hypothetical protein